KALVALFPGGASSADKRAQFYTSGQNLEISDVSTFTDGYAISKFKDVKIADGKPGSSLDYADMDLPIFRLAEQYLIYAEATTRGGAGGDMSLAVSYINKLRERAYGNTSGNVTSITTDQILDERGRELYWLHCRLYYRRPFHAVY